MKITYLEDFEKIADKIAEAVKGVLGKNINGKLDKAGDASDTIVKFTQAAERKNISAGEKLSVILGKIAKVIADLKTVAFSGKYSDLSGTPDSLPASDVPSWAKASTKPSYTPTEVGVIGTAPTSGQVAVFDGTTGKIKSNGCTVEKSVPANAEFTDTNTARASSTDSVGSASAWSAGKLPTFGTAIPADDITAWSAGTLPTLGTAIAADDITAWSAGTAASASVSKGVLTLTNGTAPSLSYTARSIPNVTDVGKLPSLTYFAKSIPNVTDAGTLPSLTVTNKTVVTGVST